jgi:hypothetical protein
LGGYHKKVLDEMTIGGVPPLIFMNHGLAKSGVDINEIHLGQTWMGTFVQFLYFCCCKFGIFPNKRDI